MNSIVIRDTGVMQLFQIEYFVAVAEAMSFTKGAQRVNIVQSAVSAGIKALERDLGADLFVRQGRHIRLAPAGEVFLPRARIILADIQAGRDAVNKLRGTVQGTVAFGTLSNVGALDVVQVLRDVHAAYPDVVVKLRQTLQGTRTSLADVVSGALDLALVSVPAGPVAGVELLTLHAEPIAFVCGAGHRLSGRTHVTLAEIAGEPFIDFPDGWGNRAVVDAAFAAQGLNRMVRTEVVSFDMARELVAQDMGVAFLPLSAAQDGTAGAVWAVPTQLTWRIQLARSSARQPTAAESVLIQTFRQAPGLP